jgi:putative ABC transport system permease protein
MRCGALAGFGAFLGLAAMAVLVACGSLSSLDVGVAPDQSPDSRASGPPTAQASLLVRKFEQRGNDGVSPRQYEQANRFMRDNAPAAFGLTPLLATRYAQTEHKPIFIKGEDSKPFSTRQYTAWGFIAFVGGFEEHVRLLEGRLANPAASGDTLVEAVMTTAKLEEVGARVGDHLILGHRLPNGDWQPIEVKIVGRWAPTNPTDAFWFYDPTYLSEGLVVAEATYFETILASYEAIGYEFTWFTVFGLEENNTDAFAAGVDHVRASLPQILGEVRIAVWPPEIATQGEERSTTQ